MLRTLWVLLVGIVYTIWWGGEILLRSALGSEKTAWSCRCRPRQWSRKLLEAAGVEVELEGLEHLERPGGQILVANHVSWFDVFVLAGHLPVDYRFVAKKELERVPIFGPAWKACEHIAIDRSDRSSAIGSLEEAARQIGNQGVTIVMFPEGTRSRDGSLMEFKKGAFVLAIQAGVPVVPAAILGSREVMPKGSWRIRSGTIRVRFGEPLAVEEMSHGERDRLTRRARERVAELLEEPGRGPSLRRRAGADAATEGLAVRREAGGQEKGARSEGMDPRERR